MGQRERPVVNTATAQLDDAENDRRTSISVQTDEIPGSGEFESEVILVDEGGWKQKLVLRFKLGVHPVGQKRRILDIRSKIITEMEIDQIQISVPRSTLADSSRPPQLHIRQVEIFLGPSIDKFTDKSRLGRNYCERWNIIDRHPTRSFYRSGPSTLGVETTWTGKINASFPPSAGLEYSRKTMKSQQLPAVTAAIDFQKSEISSETAEGGLVWKYAVDMYPKSIEEFLALDVHRAKSAVPKSNPPSSIQAEVSIILDIRKDKFLRRLLTQWKVRGFSVEYRHINIRTKVDVHWKENCAVFPTKERMGNHLAINHRFKEDGCEIPPEEAKFQEVDHELIVRRSKMTDFVGKK